MNPSTKRCPDRGSAIVDFVFYGVVIQVAILVFGLQVFSMQSAQLAAESAARHALRSFVLNGADPDESVRRIAQDFGFVGQQKVLLSCLPDCVSEGSVMQITVVVASAKASSKMIR